jgi:hypothetical protein
MYVIFQEERSEKSWVHRPVWNYGSVGGSKFFRLEMHQIKVFFIF